MKAWAEITAWLVLNVIVGLLPLFMTVIFGRYIGAKVNVNATLKDGQLFFFCVSICANSMHSLIVNNRTLKTETTTIMYVVLLLPLLFSSMSFALAMMTRLQSKENINSNFTGASIMCACITTAIGLWVYMQTK